MSGPPVRLGLLGCADIAVRRVLPAVLRSPKLSLTAVASRSVDRARAVAGEFGGSAVESYQALLARPDVEAVYLPLPAALHATWVRRALLAGKHVLAEKPLTTDPAQTAELVALAAARGQVLRENVMFPQHPQHQRVRSLLAGGAIGRIRVLTASFTIPPRPRGDIRYRADLGGGALLDVGYYPLRAALFLLGNELELAGAVLHHHPEHEVDVAGSALLRRPDGVSVQLSFGMDHHYTSRYEVLGTGGVLRLEHAFTPPADRAASVAVECPDSVERQRLAPYDQCLGTVEHFADAVRSGAGSTNGETIVRHAQLTAAIQRQADATPQPAAAPRWGSARRTGAARPGRRSAPDLSADGALQPALDLRNRP